MPPRGMLRWPGLERIGTLLLLVLVVAIVLVQGTGSALDLASDDAFARADMADGLPPRPRTPVGMWLSPRLTSDVGPGSSALRERGDALFHLANRLREIAGAAALFGLLLAPLTAGAEVGAARPRETSAPAAKTASNGTV